MRKTWVLCFNLLNDLEWMIRSRSCWKAGLRGHSSSGERRPFVSELNVAKGEKNIFSRSSSSSRIVLAIAFSLFHYRACTPKCLPFNTQISHPPPSPSPSEGGRKGWGCRVSFSSFVVPSGHEGLDRWRLRTQACCPSAVNRFDLIKIIAPIDKNRFDLLCFLLLRYHKKVTLSNRTKHGFESQCKIDS
jgi:hypothetical protein